MYYRYIVYCTVPGVNLRDTDLRSRRTNTKDRKSHSPVAFRSYIPVLQLSLLALSFWFLACRSHYKYDTRTRQTASRSNCRIRSSHWRTLFFMIQQIKFKIQNAIDKKWDSEFPQFIKINFKFCNFLKTSFFLAHAQIILSSFLQVPFDFHVHGISIVLVFGFGQWMLIQRHFQE